jgi:thioesterase domain-containing protein
VARGYLNDPAKTAAAFVPDPYAPVPGARCYRTGDLARFRPDGNLEFLGRIDGQIKFLGYRIEPGEIEAQLRAHPDVRDAVVVAREDPPAGTRLVAYVVPGEGGPPDLAGLREFLARTLPGHMLPAASVALDELPRTPAGKVDHRALPRPSGAAPARRDYVAPRNATQRVIAEVWASVLGVDKVGIEDPFTDLGGHSLAAMRVSALLRASHELSVSPRDVLRNPTVTALAAIATAKAAGGGAAPAYLKLTEGQDLGPDGTLVWFRRTGTRPVFFCVHDSATGCFGDLAAELGEDQPVAAIQHPAMIDSAHAGMPIGDLAELYARSVRAAQPDGPYHLLGWCSGVPVVWELARLLAADGAQVAVYMLDPKLGNPTGRGSIPATERLGQCEDLLDRLRADPHGPDSGELRREILNLLSGLFPEGVEAHAPDAANVDEGWPEVVRTWRRQAQARLDHRFEPLRCTVHLLASDEVVRDPGFFCDTATYEDYLSQWRRLAGGELLVHRVPGEHDGMMRPPLVTEFARLLRGILAGSPGD